MNSQNDERTPDEILDDINDLIVLYNQKLLNDCQCGNTHEYVYLQSWALVMCTGDLRHDMAATYNVAAYPSNQPPHAVKGLFSEGVDKIVNDQIEWMSSFEDDA